jgi:hypothetical protein
MNRDGHSQGAVTIYFLLFTLMVFGFLVMAVDVGRMYLIQGELQTAAASAAMAAALQLVGTANATVQANHQVAASFDTTTSGENRFNLRISQIGADSRLVTEMAVDYHSTLLDALAGVNGGQDGGIDWSSGIYPKYARVRISSQAPVVFAPLLSPAIGSLPTIAVSAVAGISIPVCTACGIDAFAVEDLSAGVDELNYGFTPGAFYTLYLTQSQQGRPRPVTQSPLAGTVAAVRYAVLNHLPGGPEELDPDGTLFALAAGGISSAADLSPPGTVSIGSAETGYSIPTDGGFTAGQDILCGLNTRFAVDPSENICASLASGAFSGLSLLYRTDTDLGRGTFTQGEALQDYATEYDGNLRRVLTIAIIDSTDSLTVMNFRQFLIEMSPSLDQGLNPTLVSGAFIAQYLGTPVPLRCGGIGGSCRVSYGIGRIVLHS